MSGAPPTGGDFRIFVQKIALQGFYALGLVEIPGAPRPPKPNLDAARMVVEDLKMIRSKTEGNLDPGERMTLDKYVADLQMQIVERGRGGGENGGGEGGGDGGGEG